jgi:hypothetical protein
MRPVRLQLSRRKGFDLQALSVRTNGLPAVNVARPTSYGNPFVIGSLAPQCYARFHKGVVENAEQAVSLFRRALAYELSKTTPAADTAIDLVASLHGRNLACWCKPGAPCHADVLLELANRPACEEVRP